MNAPPPHRPQAIPAYPEPEPPPPPPALSAGYIPWWLLALVAAAFVCAGLVLAAAVAYTRQADLPQATATAIVITAVPGGAQPGGDGPTPTAAATTAPTDTPPPPPPGEVAVGGYVQVVGTGDAGFLNLRAEAGLNAPVNYLAIENEVFQVQAGPTSADGFTWWYLVNPTDSSRYGWGVQNYLQVVQGP